MRIWKKRRRTGWNTGHLSLLLPEVTINNTTAIVATNKAEHWRPQKFARERSRLPGRIVSMLYNGYCTWRRYGKWTTSGMMWDQVRNKYEDQVLREAALLPLGRSVALSRDGTTVVVGAPYHNHFDDDQGQAKAKITWATTN
mmetsp:Transcript_6657/g.11810  ORF Transcript_6657/g.11810 Transcript_6657/m.11810 type:complete len:142 (+) Transcript_6657:807-1232(+)